MPRPRHRYLAQLGSAPEASGWAGALRRVYSDHTERKGLLERFTQEQPALFRRSRQHTARRGTQLRAGYEGGYRAPRLRLRAGCPVGATLAVASVLPAVVAG
ncbi:hypothetical protein [Streptomyces sp. NPDC093261]|uniref:hypothetical protein n=1 Tax=Streptomyces sp. NPDC093261 TaxID=3366037 RepID=UPI00382A598F